MHRRDSTLLSSFLNQSALLLSSFLFFPFPFPPFFAPIFQPHLFRFLQVLSKSFCPGSSRNPPSPHTHQTSISERGRGRTKLPIARTPPFPIYSGATLSSGLVHARNRVIHISVAAASIPYFPIKYESKANRNSSQRSSDTSTFPSHLGPFGRSFPVREDETRCYLTRLLRKPFLSDQ